MVSIFLVLGAVVVAAGALSQRSSRPAEPAGWEGRALKSVTLNTGKYMVSKGVNDRRSVKITAEEDIHIVALEHFVGVSRGAFSDNGHILSTKPENVWLMERGAPGMEPNGTTGYFGYCGRDYYSECAGIGDVTAYERFPAGTHVLIRKGETLYMHCCGAPGPQNGQFHNMVRVLYW